MKRIYACIAIVAALLSVAFYSSWKVQSFADVISADLDTAAEAVRNADYPAARVAVCNPALFKRILRNYRNTRSVGAYAPFRGQKFHAQKKRR